jgi:hypothetical protein
MVCLAPQDRPDSPARRVPQDLQDCQDSLALWARRDLRDQPDCRDALITTSAASSKIELRNPAGNTPALTITALAGGTHPAVASIVIQQLGYTSHRRDP